MSPGAYKLHPFGMLVRREQLYPAPAAYDCKTETGCCSLVSFVPGLSGGRSLHKSNHGTDAVTFTKTETRILYVQIRYETSKAEEKADRKTFRLVGTTLWIGHSCKRFRDVRRRCPFMHFRHREW